MRRSLAFNVALSLKTGLEEPPQPTHILSQRLLSHCQLHVFRHVSALPKELEQPDGDLLLDCLGPGPREAVRTEIAERAANRRGLRPPAADVAEGDAGGVQRRRPLPPLPPEVKAARDALAAQEP